MAFRTYHQMRGRNEFEARGEWRTDEVARRRDGSAGGEALSKTTRPTNLVEESDEKKREGEGGLAGGRGAHVRATLAQFRHNHLMASVQVSASSKIAAEAGGASRRRRSVKASTFGDSES